MQDGGGTDQSSLARDRIVSDSKIMPFRDVSNLGHCGGQDPLLASHRGGEESLEEGRV